MYYYTFLQMLGYKMIVRGPSLSLDLDQSLTHPCVYVKNEVGG